MGGLEEAFESLVFGASTVFDGDKGISAADGGAYGKSEDVFEHVEFRALDPRIFKMNEAVGECE